MVKIKIKQILKRCTGTILQLGESFSQSFPFHELKVSQATLLHHSLVLFVYWFKCVNIPFINEFRNTFAGIKKKLFQLFAPIFQISNSYFLHILCHVLLILVINMCFVMCVIFHLFFCSSFPFRKEQELNIRKMRKDSIRVRYGLKEKDCHKRSIHI